MGLTVAPVVPDDRSIFSINESFVLHNVVDDCLSLSHDPNSTKVTSFVQRDIIFNPHLPRQRSPQASMHRADRDSAARL